jgi:hypothetical protein
MRMAWSVFKWVVTVPAMMALSLVFLSMIDRALFGGWRPPTEWDDYLRFVVYGVLVLVAPLYDRTDTLRQEYQAWKQRTPAPRDWSGTAIAVIGASTLIYMWLTGNS